jgi:hypothetical protein
MRNVLVASLCVLGTFLLTYKGYDKLDSRITNVCGAATIGVALFPTSNRIQADLGRSCAPGHGRDRAGRAGAEGAAVHPERAA